LRTLAAEHGPRILTIITRAYGLPWPRDGSPIHVTAYANWSGAFAVTGGLILISSMDGALHRLAGLETAFHESMHQWDDVIEARIASEGRKQGRAVPPGLSHAMIFYTAGEATRRVAPGYVPYADANGNWRRGLRAFKIALDEIWKPYLDGSGTRDEAIAALVARVGLAR
jgi:hypothetical protein